MKYYGIDIHKKYSTFAVVNDQGKVMNQGKIENNLEAFRKVIDTPPWGARAVIEATANWYYIHDLLADMVDEVTVAHPLRTKAIASARIKTDKIDANTLAQLLRADLIPQSYIAPPEIRDLRELLRYRASLVRIRTMIKNKVHAILIKGGINSTYSDIFGKRGREWLATVGMRPAYRLAIDGYLKLIDFLNEQIKPVTHEIDLKAKADPRAILLETIPGIGHYSAMLILGEVGDFSRFPTARHLVSYAGLNPAVHSSGGITRYGRITKQGSRWLRWIMVEVASIAYRHSHRLRSLHMRVAYKHGNNTAHIAVAREILTIGYHLLRKGESYKEWYE
jgi:transposase